MKMILILVAFIIPTSALAVGNTPSAMSDVAMKSELDLYRAVIDDTDCKNLVPISGVMTGGGMPGHEANYETLQLAVDSKSKPSAQLTLSWLKSSAPIAAQSKTTVSFECLKLD